MAWQNRLSRRNVVQGLEGSRVGRYVLEDCLGHGSHTAVYRAWAPAGEWCALKLVDTQVQGGDDLAERLRRDATLMERADHPHIWRLREELPEVTDDAIFETTLSLVVGGLTQIAPHPCGCGRHEPSLLRPAGRHSFPDPLPK